MKLKALLFGGFAAMTVLSAKAQDLTLEDYFTPVTNEAAAPDGDGFIRRWMLLEPISKPNRGNTVFTDSYVRAAFDTVYYKDQKTMLPKDGQKVSVVVPIEQPVKMPTAPAAPANRPAGAPGAAPAGMGAPGAAPGGAPGANQAPPQMDFRRMMQPEIKMTKMKLAWHALDSKRFNVKLYRFATGLNLQRYGVIFHAVTIINCEEDIPNVRLSVGSNSASQWWLNGEDVLILSGDRRMVKDDCASKRVTLKKGKNILRGAVINGPGMSDFCVRFLDEAGNPVKNLSVTVK